MPTSGASATGTLDLGGMVVSTGVFVASPGRGGIFYPTTAVNLAVDGGSEVIVQTGGVIDGGTVAGAYPLITLGSENLPIASLVAAVSGGIVSGVTFGSAGTADGALVGTELDVDAWGSALANVLTGAATEVVSSGGYDNGVAIGAGSQQDVMAGGTATGAIVSRGGEQIVDFSGSGSDGGTVSGTALLVGGTLYFPDIPYFDGTTSVSFDSGTHTLTIDDGSFAESITLMGDYSATGFSLTSGGVDADQTGGASVTAVACYVQGTHIATERGDVAIETIEPGDRILTDSGAVRVATRAARPARLRHPSPPRRRPGPSLAATPVGLRGAPEMAEHSVAPPAGRHRSPPPPA